MKTNEVIKGWIIFREYKLGYSYASNHHLQGFAPVELRDARTFESQAKAELFLEENERYKEQGYRVGYFLGTIIEAPKNSELEAKLELRKLLFKYPYVAEELLNELKRDVFVG